MTDDFVPSPAAQAQGICHTEEECRDLYLHVNLAKRRAAVAFLRSKFSLEDRSKMAALLERYGSGEWLHHLYDEEIERLSPDEKQYAALLSPHFGFGMQVRNTLRRAGFGERELGVHNLDCVYVHLIEEALRDPASQVGTWSTYNIRYRHLSDDREDAIAYGVMSSKQLAEQTKRFHDFSGGRWKRFLQTIRKWWKNA